MTEKVIISESDVNKVGRRFFAGRIFVEGGQMFVGNVANPKDVVKVQSTRISAEEAVKRGEKAPYVVGAVGDEGIFIDDLGRVKRD